MLFLIPHREVQVRHTAATRLFPMRLAVVRMLSSIFGFRPKDIKEGWAIDQLGSAHSQRIEDQSDRPKSRPSLLSAFGDACGALSVAFQGLANPARIAIVELLRDAELSAWQLMERLHIEQANASQHLAVLLAKQIVVTRKVGNQVCYSIRDRALIEILDVLRRYFYAQLSTTVNMTKEAAREEPQSRRGAHR